MQDLGVPCPACGSLEVNVGRPEAAELRAAGADSPRGHVPRLRRCDCRECHLTFRHDFAFTS